MSKKDITKAFIDEHTTGQFKASNRDSGHRHEIARLVAQIADVDQQICEQKLVNMVLADEIAELKQRLATYE